MDGQFENFGANDDYQDSFKLLLIVHLCLGFIGKDKTRNRFKEIVVFFLSECITVLNKIYEHKKNLVFNFFLFSAYISSNKINVREVEKFRTMEEK